VGFLLILVSGWLGGELVYRRGVGVSAGSATPGAERPERVGGHPLDARSRL
jgi:hypothetical protein